MNQNFLAACDAYMTVCAANYYSLTAMAMMTYQKQMPKFLGYVHNNSKPNPFFLLERDGYFDAMKTGNLNPDLELKNSIKYNAHMSLSVPLLRELRRDHPDIPFRDLCIGHVAHLERKLNSMIRYYTPINTPELHNLTHFTNLTHDEELLRDCVIVEFNDIVKEISDCYDCVHC